MKFHQIPKPEYLLLRVVLLLLAAMTLPMLGVTVPLRRGRLSPKDYRFAVAAARGNLMEIELGQLAVRTTRDPRVKEFGQEMVRDHQLENEGLENVLSDNGATMPRDLTYPQQREINHLSTLSGRQFDLQYMALMIREHLKYLTNFNDAALWAKNPGLRKFSANTARVTQYDLNMAEGLRNGK